MTFLELTPTARLGDLVLTEYPYILGADPDFGAGENVYETMEWLLADGESVSSHRTSNRSLTFVVYVEGATQAELAANEIALVRECDRQLNELEFHPGAGGVGIVFDVARAQVRQPRSEAREAHLIRQYEITVSAQPFGRSLDPVVVNAIGSGSGTTVTPTVTTIWSDAAGLSAWSAAFPGGGLGVQSAGGVGVRNSTPAPNGFVSHLTYSAAFTHPDPWLAVEWAATLPFPAPPIFARVGGLTVTLAPSAVMGSTAYYYSAPGFGWTSLAWPIPTGGQLAIVSIKRQNSMPYSTTTRQISRVIDVRGSARTTLDVTMLHTAALGEAHIFACPEDGSGYQPPLRRHRTLTGLSPAIVADATAINGSRMAYTASTVDSYEIPIRSLPEGAYSVLVRHKPTALSGRSWTITSSVAMGAVEVSPWSSAPIYRDGTAAGVWTTTDLGLVILPTTSVAVGSTAKVRVTLACTQSTAVDEVWLYDVIRGRLIRVDCGLGAVAAGGASNRLDILSPSVTDRRPRVFVSKASDSASSRHADLYREISSYFPLEVSPGPMNLFTVAAVENAAVSAIYSPRWHHHASEVPS